MKTTHDNSKVYLMHVESGSVDTKDNWYAECKEIGEVEWFGFLDSDEMEEKGFDVEEHFWDENLVEVIWNDKENCWVEK